MSMSTTAIFTCDRDGVVSASQPGWPNQPMVPLPDGWSRFGLDNSTGGGNVQSHVGHLCPQCTAAFQQFLVDGGGEAMFTKPAVIPVMPAPQS
jgi:hypothetical protein